MTKDNRYGMRVIWNSFIPFRGFLAVNLFGTLFAHWADSAKITEQVINHEQIHTAQMRELWYVGFYLLYFLEWLLRLITNPGDAYNSISFEEEAYRHERDINYLASRKKFAQWKNK